MVFVHGITLDARMWDDQMDTFSRHHMVVRYDIRGFGRSVVPTGRYNHSEDLMSLLKSLDLSKVHICGLSMGGRFSLNFALAYPEAVSSLTLADSGLGGYHWSKEFEAFLGTVKSTAKKLGVEEAKKLWLRGPLFKLAMEDPKLASRLTQMVGNYSGWHWTNHDPEEIIDPPAIGRLNSVRLPTLVLVGEYDEPDFQLIAELLVKGMPEAQKQIVKGAGHMTNMEKPHEFNEILLRFLSSLS